MPIGRKNGLTLLQIPGSIKREISSLCCGLPFLPVVLKHLHHAPLPHKLYSHSCCCCISPHEGQKGFSNYTRPKESIVSPSNSDLPSALPPSQLLKPKPGHYPGCFSVLHSPFPVRQFHLDVPALGHFLPSTALPSIPLHESSSTTAVCSLFHSPPLQSILHTAIKRKVS